MNIAIKENSWLARIAARKLAAKRVAIVIGTTIYLYNISREKFLEDKCWVCHELKHIDQFKRYGFARFIFMYLRESMRKGYYNNRFEKEARDYETDITLLHGVNFV